MGQRLCLQINRNRKPVANAYYHWSGYTLSSMALLEQVYSYLSDHMDDEDKKLVAIRALESTGAGIEKYDGEISDYDILKRVTKYKDVDFSIGNDRNDGLIACFPKSMQGLYDASEEYCSIDMDTLLIDFDVLCHYDTIEEIKEWCEGIAEDDIPEYEASPYECDIGTLRDLIDGIQESNFIKCSDGYYGEIG